jgi:GPH family glycoside/pentoside/hexuronide:cation symporter
MSNFVDKLKGLFSNESLNGTISNRAKFFLAFPGMPVTVGNVLIHNAYIKYYSDVIGLDVSMVGTIYLIFGIWNAINDPMLGVVIDRFKFTKQRGKYVYFMRVTAPLIIFSSFAMLFSQPSWNEWVIFAVFLVLLFIFDTAQTAYSIAYASYILVAAPSKNERVDVSVIGAYIGNIGGFFGTIIPTLLLVGENDKSITVFLFSGVLVLNSFLYWIAVRNIHDKEEMYKDDVRSSEGELAQYVRESSKEAFTSRSFVTFVLYQVLGRGPIMFYFTPFLYLMDHVFKFSGGQATAIDVSSGLVMFLVVPTLGKYVKKIGLKRSIIISSFPAALGFLSLYFAQNFWQAMLAYWLIIVASQVGYLSQPPMLGAIIDEDEQKTDVRKAGLFTGLNALITIPVSGIQAAIFTNLISQYGFTSGSVDQSLRALEGIRIGAGVIPFFFVLLGILPMLLSPITQEKEVELSAFSEQRHRVEPQIVGAGNGDSII